MKAASRRSTSSFAVSAVTALALFAISGPATAGQSASAERGSAKAVHFSVHFVARTLNGNLVAVKRFRFSGLRAKCKQGFVRIHSKRHLPAMPVHRRRFHGFFSRQGEHVAVKGIFTHGTKRASGSLRVRGHFGKFTHCHSGKRHWRVGRT